ncbi:MAG: DEAD/DEAH box helicase, partial [bacterium]|nr:DEAD/DEAH box helicase [bacterium]
PPEPPPQPHAVQQEALAALTRTREEGNRAGLVVMATGLGKTWLAAFDSVDFPRVLFVAHREEILAQALRAFRRVRPHARCGFYKGDERDSGADLLFASIQTLGRQAHLDRFARDRFDYIVVDEFHHASARTYRQLLDHFEPRFMLGLTATPERTDGGDLLALCGENLVYRCDLVDGIGRELLCPFHDYGVPDEVDYANIPWRNNRFDPEELTAAVSTQARAANALEQHRIRGGQRTVAFCCSVRHARFMRDYFAEAGLRVAAVHSGGDSDPRAASLEKLATGELDVVFSVDMFNEGMDLPQIDTVMMLRPTESRILWLQQFGRGLRKAVGKDRLFVIDYIGNHRAFLLKPQTLFNLPQGDAHVARILNLVQSGQADLPPGCEVTYDLEAVEILESLLRLRKGHDALLLWYQDFRERQGERPRAVEAFHEGYNPRSVRSRYGSWFGLVRDQGDLSHEEGEALRAAATFLSEMETTGMVKSYKMVLLQALLESGRFPGEIGVDELTEAFARVAGRSSRLRQDVSVPLEDRTALRALLIKNPVKAWTSSGADYFTYEAGVFRSRVAVPDAFVPPLVELTRELVEWRLAEYLSRATMKESGWSLK